MSTTLSPHHFPSAIRGKLQSVRWRHAALSLTFAIAFAVAAWLFLMVVAMAIDWMYPFASAWLRIVLTGTTVTAAIGVVCWLGIGPVRRALQWARAASAVDSGIPELEERWSTVTSLSRRDISQLSPLERAMAAQVTSEAIAMERIVQPHRVGPPVSLRPAFASAAVGAGFIAVMFAVAPQQTSVLLRRFFSPTLALTATQLDSVTGDQWVPRGESVDLVIQMRGVPRSSATLTVVLPDGREQDYRLRPDEATAGQFVHSIRVDDSMSYRVRAGDAQTPWYQIQAIDYPELAEVRFKIEFPEYTGRESVQRDRFPRQIKVVQGSTLQLSIKPAEPLERCALSLSNPNAGPSATISVEQSATTVEHLLSADKENWYHFEMQLVEDILLQPMLLSPHGLENRRRQFTRIDVIADKAPVARVTKPTDEMAVAEDATIDIEFEAHDDHGIATAELVVYDESQRDAEGNAKVLKVQPIPLDEQAMQRHILGKTQLDLKQLELSEGQEISYAVRVTDNRNVRLSDDQLATPNSTLAQSDQPANNANPQTDEPRPSSDAESLAVGEMPAKSEATSEHPPSEAQPPADAESLAAGEIPAKSEATSENPASEAHPSADAESLAAGEIPAKSEATSEHPPSEAQPPADAESLAAGEMPAKSDGTSENPASDSQPSADAESQAVGKMPAKSEATSENRASDLQPPADAESLAAGEMPAKSEATSEHPPSEAQPPADAESLAADEMPAKSEATSEHPPSEAQPSADAESLAAGEMPAKSEATSENPASEAQPSADAAALAASEMPAKAEGNAAMEQQPAQTPVNPSARPGSPAANAPSSPRPASMANNSESQQLIGQRSGQGQNTLTGRRRLKITATLSALADAEDQPGEDQSIREKVVEIDRMLTEVETGLQKLVDRAIADTDRGEQWQRLDTSLGNVETFVAELREQTKENKFAFVGLQMVDITRTHVTPARDRVFAGTQRPGASDVDAKMAWQHVLRARELLAALLKRYDRVEQEKNLEEEMDEAITMYEVYIKKRQMLMREARQNLNPLERKMGVIEVDQAYLDRLAEVLKLRREMMEEFAQMLGDDPRLLSRYMELIKRRQTSLRDQLTEISQRQFDMIEETLNWLQIDDSQRADLWTIIIDLRLAAADDLAKDASELAERIEKQMPLDLEVDAGTPAEIIAQAKHIATAARTVRMDADDVAAEYGKAKHPDQLRGHAHSLTTQCERLFALLDRLQFENGGNDGVDQYVESRIQETRAVADQANVWSNLSGSIAAGSYSSLVETEQHRLAISTQLLRVNMLEMEGDLIAQFQRILDEDLPGEIKDMIRRLHRLMEAITFNQLAASFRSGQDLQKNASQQQQLASDRLAEAEALFDRIRRAVVERLDENDPDDPNIADLQDPTLDAFLAQLEREPNIATQLGIPNRRTNLRVRSDSLLWQQSPLNALGMSAAAAGQRAQQAMKMQRGESDVAAKQGRPDKPQSQADKPESPERSQAEQQQREEAQRAQDLLAKTLAEIEKQRGDPELPAGQRERLDQMAENLRKLLEPSDGDESAEQAWQRVVQADQAEELMRAIAAGEAIADEQWNRLISTLDDGLWQTRGNRPPQAYRQAIEQYQDQIRDLMQTIDE